MFGSTEPRVFTPPLRELTPETSYGFAVIDFARDILKQPLDPWQEWAVIHAGELLESGMPRFRQVLIIVARQNGKTHLLKVLSLFWMYVDVAPMILGISTKLEYAKEAMVAAITVAEATPALSKLLPGTYKKLGNNDIRFFNSLGSTYKVAATNANAGRSMTVHRLIVDELRQQHDFTAWDACIPTMNAVPDAQAYCITNQGDVRSVVLDSLRTTALAHIKHGDGDDSLGLFEWSAPPSATLMDPEGWKAANPNLGYRIPEFVVRQQAQQALESGGEKETGFRTEILCQKVSQLDAAVDPLAWEQCYVEGNMDNLRTNVALCIDVSPDMRHGTVAVAAKMPDGRIRVEIVKAYSGNFVTRDMKRDLPTWVARTKPRTVGWFPIGPAASMATALADRKGIRNWPPPGVTVSEIKSETYAVCMGFSEQVSALQVVHGDEDLLNAHVTGAAKLYGLGGDTWRFSRKGQGHCDAAYAAAGAVFLAQTLPDSSGPFRIVTRTNG